MYDRWGGLRNFYKMAALIEGTGTTKAQSYKMSVERNAVLTGQNKSSLLVVRNDVVPTRTSIFV